ncbi:MAG: T9SS type A sorting domain-containing protein, partial [Saprospiraceae bacterium]
LISVTAANVQNRNVADVELTAGSLVAVSGSTVTLEMKSKNFISGAVMQFSIQWPTDKLELANLPSGSDIGLPGNTIFDQTQLAQGKLGFIWETDNFGSGTTLADNSMAFRLKFKVLGPNNSTLKVENSLTPKVSKFLDVNGAEVPLKINAGTVTIALPSAIKDEMLDKIIKVYPNPTTGIISIESDFNDIKNLNIRSLDGKLMLHIPELKGNTIDLSHLAPGSYVIKGLIDIHPFVKKVVIVK